MDEDRANKNRAERPRKKLTFAIPANLQFNSSDLLDNICIDSFRFHFIGNH